MYELKKKNLISNPRFHTNHTNEGNNGMQETIRPKQATKLSIYCIQKKGLTNDIKPSK